MLLLQIFNTHPSIFLPALSFSLQNRKPKEAFKKTPTYAHLYSFTQDKVLTLLALNPTPSPCVFKDTAQQSSPTSKFPSIMDLYLRYIYMALFPLLVKKKSQPHFSLQLPHFSLPFSLQAKILKSCVLCLLVLFSQLNSFKSVHAFNMPPKTVKKKTSDLTL